MSVVDVNGTSAADDRISRREGCQPLRWLQFRWPALLPLAGAAHHRAGVVDHARRREVVHQARVLEVLRDGRGAVLHAVHGDSPGNAADAAMGVSRTGPTAHGATGPVED